MTNFAIIEEALNRQSAAISRMVQRHPSTHYNHTELWDLVDAAKKELREAQQPSAAAPETVSNDKTIIVTFENLAFEVGHYDALPRQVVEKLKEAGIPVIGDWMLRGVSYGKLTTTYHKPTGVSFIWHSLGEEPEVDLVEELI